MAEELLRPRSGPTTDDGLPAQPPRVDHAGARSDDQSGSFGTDPPPAPRPTSPIGRSGRQGPG